MGTGVTSYEMNDVRCTNGVRPVEDDGAERSGPGSEKRTLFFDFERVFAGPDGNSKGFSFSGMFRSCWASARAVLHRLLRRIATGWSSASPGVWMSGSICAIADHLLSN